MTNKSLRHRIHALEGQGSTDADDNQVKVQVCWCAPGQCTCPPADKVITWDDIDYDITGPVKGESEVDNGQDD